jgi:hypothetical protein
LTANLIKLFETIKKIKLMKRLIFFVIFIVFLSKAFAGDNPIDLSKVPSPPPPPPIPTAPVFELPVSATISETQLSVYFEPTVGDATITVYDADNNVVYQETVDTDSTPNVFISSTNWSAGSYTITITYGTTSVIGYFEME